MLRGLSEYIKGTLWASLVHIPDTHALTQAKIRPKAIQHFSCSFFMSRVKRAWTKFETNQFNHQLESITHFAQLTIRKRQNFTLRNQNKKHKLLVHIF